MKNTQATRGVLAYMTIVIAFTFTTWRAEDNAKNIRDETIARTDAIAQESRTRADELERESIAGAKANCDASNESRRAIRDFVRWVVEADGEVTSGEAVAVEAADAQFPERECLSEAG